MTALGRIKRLGEGAWYIRSRIPALDVPLPWPLPYGGWFLAHGDAMGARIVGYRLSRSPYEEAQWRFVSRHLPDGGTFVDVGANQGFFTILASRRVGESGRVFAFEPATTEAHKLRANLWINRCRNAIVEAIALGAEPGTADFFMYLGHQGSWSGLHEGAEDVEVAAKVIKVPVVTLDSYLTEKGAARLDLMKIDVEGGELNVLKGATESIRRHRPLVICEVERRRTLQWGYEPSAILDALKTIGYEWWTLTSAGDLRHPASGADDQNLLAVPSEKVAGLSRA